MIFIQGIPPHLCGGFSLYANSKYSVMGNFLAILAVIAVISVAIYYALIGMIKDNGLTVVIDTALVLAIYFTILRRFD